MPTDSETVPQTQSLLDKDKEKKDDASTIDKPKETVEKSTKSFQESAKAMLDTFKESAKDYFANFDRYSCGRLTHNILVYGCLAIVFWIVFWLVVAWLSGYFYGAGCYDDVAREVVKHRGAKFQIKDWRRGKSGDLHAEPNYHLWHEYAGKMTDHFQAWGGRKFAYAKAEDAPHMMFNATKVKGVFEHVPEKLKGVFWMDGLNNPEILSTFQYSRYFEDEGVLVAPKSPFYWAYWGGEHKAPAKSGCSGLMEYISILWGTCPAQKTEYLRSSGKQIADWYTTGTEELWVWRIEQGGSNPLIPLKAHIQMYAFGNLSEIMISGLPMDYTFTELPFSMGTKFERGMYWVCGALPIWPWGYQAKKVIDANGNRVQPYFDQFLEFMGDTKAILMYDAPGW